MLGGISLGIRQSAIFAPSVLSNNGSRRDMVNNPLFTDEQNVPVRHITRDIVFSGDWCSLVRPVVIVKKRKEKEEEIVPTVLQIC